MPPEARAGGRVQRHHRLVEQEQLGVHPEGAGEGEPTQRATRKLTRKRLADLVEADVPEGRRARSSTAGPFGAQAADCRAS